MPQLSSFPIVAGAIAVVVVIGILILLALFRRPKPVKNEEVLPTLDLDSLKEGEIPSVPRLEIYHIPVQLAAIVIAPAGRNRELPDLHETVALIDHLAPGFGEVFTQHEPKVVFWPAQLSTEGFIRSFFRHVPLPGSKGRGTPWCSLAGRIETTEETLLVGLVCRAANANSLSQIFIDRASKWLDVVRIRDGE